VPGQFEMAKGVEMRPHPTAFDCSPFGLHNHANRTTEGWGNELIYSILLIGCITWFFSSRRKTFIRTFVHLGLALSHRSLIDVHSQPG
jgi:hypothetical protein